MQSLEEVSVNPNLPLEKVKLDGGARVDLVYGDQLIFDQPLVIRGTNKQFVPSHEMVSLEVPSEERMDSLIDLCRGADDTLELMTLQNISDLEIVAVTDSYLVLSYSQGDKVIHFVMESPTEGSETKIAFKRFSSLLKIPYAFSRRNPGFLNKMNFEYWQKVLSTVEDKKIPIDIIFQKESFRISTEGDQVQAYLIVNIKKARQTRGKDSEVIESTLMERVPLFSKILENIRTQIGENFPEMKTSLQSYSLGYTGGNKGRHFARIIFDGPESILNVGEDAYSLACSIDTDFIGTGSNGSDLHVSFGLYREVCSNGLVVSWTKEQQAEIQELYISNYLKELGIGEEDEKYESVRMESATKFSTLFSKEGFSIPVAIANSMFETSGFPQIFEFFKKNVNYLKASIEELNIEFGEISDREFVDTSLEISRDLKMSPEVLKYFLIEYLAGNFAGQEQVFKTPLDILNFLTYICRAYSSSVQFDVEKKAYLFATGLAMTLIHKTRTEKSNHNHFMKQVNPDLLVN